MNIGFVSIYPNKQQKHGSTGGVASYTYNLVHSIPKQDTDNYFVIADMINGKKEFYKEDGDIKVDRCFNRGPFFIFQILTEIYKRKIDIVHIQHELFLYGRYVSAFAVPIMLLLLLPKKVIVTMHGVVDIDSINKDFIKENNSRLPVWVIKYGFWILYKLISLFSNLIIVHENVFKNRLEKQLFVKSKKIEVVHHGIEKFQKSKDTEVIKDKLNIPKDKRIVLYMGYISGYKNIDLLIDGVYRYLQDYGDDIYLIIGGGIHPKYIDDDNYINNQYLRLKIKAEKNLGEKHCKWAGFIDEKDITDYFSIADYSVFPYTTAMSASGPMAISMGYKVPFLASSVFRPYFAGYRYIFELDERSLADLLDRIKKDKINHEQDFNFEDRLWDRIGQKYHKIYLDLIR